MKPDPLLIVFEGIDGSGKSTQWKMILDYLTSKDISCAALREPTDGVWGQKIRRVLQGIEEADPREQLRLFLLDRDEDCEKNIRPALAAGDTVIMDRYFYSNAAYQGALGLDPDMIINENMQRGFPVPDRVYFIDIPPATAMERIMLRNGGGSAELFEKLSFLSRVRDIFLSITDQRFLIVDGTETPEEINRIVTEDFNSIRRLQGV